MSVYPVLTVKVPALMLWTQHGGGCRCLCGIYHPASGRSGCDQPEHGRLMIRLELTDHSGTPLPGADELLPVCRRCYLALSPTTGTARASATAPTSLRLPAAQHRHTAEPAGTTADPSAT